MDLFQHPSQVLESWHHPVFKEKEIEVKIVRGDLFHPWIQGNKWYKLRHYAESAKKTDAEGFISIGGPWSNHLLALAAYAKDAGLSCRFFIRGDESEWRDHPPIRQLRHWNVDLIPVQRSVFRQITSGQISISEPGNDHKNHIFVPLGASSAQAVTHVADWASELLGLWDFSDLALAVASGGSIAGMRAGLPPNRKVHGVDVLGSGGKLRETVADLLSGFPENLPAGICWHWQYDGGGFARKDPASEPFRQHFESETGIPTEHVYIGKVLFAVSDLASKGHFSPGSKILVIHNGGIFNWNSMD